MSEKDYPVTQLMADKLMKEFVDAGGILRGEERMQNEIPVDNVAKFNRQMIEHLIREQEQMQKKIEWLEIKMRELRNSMRGNY